MKKFCVIEQGMFTDDFLTTLHKEWFTKEYCDWYRINWKTDLDSNATHFASDICWSEGRSIVYEQIEKKYEYYIFIDDDLIFERHDGTLIEDPAKVILEFLEEYNPISASFAGEADWVASLIKKGISKFDVQSKKAFCGPTHDLMFCIYSSDLAKLVFPIVYHGSGGCHHYSHYVCFKLFPEKQHIYTGMLVKGIRGYAYGHKHYDRELQQFNDISLIYEKFNQHTKLKDFQLGWTDSVWENCEYFFYSKNKPSKQKQSITLEDLETIYEVSNSDYVNRKSKAL